jgi:hypothetical protein
MNEKKPLTEEEIAEIVRGLDPADWVQFKLIANLPPERRIIPAMRAQAFAMGTLRCTLEKRYPNLTRSEVSMKVLEHFTTVRM